MKATITKLAIAVALTAMLGVFTACDDGSGGGDNNNGGDNNGNGGGDGAETADASIAPTITTASLPNGTVDVEYSQTLTATGTTPITWSIDGALPAGLSLEGATISGTPTAGGQSTFTVKAANAANFDTKELSITVPIPYVVLLSGSNFTASGGGLSTPATSTAIQDVINAIKEDADGVACSIRFGSGTTALSLGTNSIEFTGEWGAITLLGSVTSADVGSNKGTINLRGSVSIESRGTIANTDYNTYRNAIYSNSTGTVTVSSGTVSASSGTAIYNSTSAGKINVLGDAVVTSRASTTSDATINSYNGTVTVSGGTVRNTATTGSDGMAIRCGNGVVIISGGTVSATTGRAISNQGTGTVTVSGGTVSATTGYAIYNDSTGVINVSGTAEVTSAQTSNGTIYIANSGSATADRLVISGGTVSNTANNNGYAICNRSTGGAKVSGGAVFAYGSARTDVVLTSGSGSITREGNGLIVWWDNTGSPGPFASGDTTGLGSEPGTATKTWGTSGTDSGINYTNGDNAGFIKVAGATVN